MINVGNLVWDLQSHAYLLRKPILPQAPRSIIARRHRLRTAGSAQPLPHPPRSNTLPYGYNNTGLSALLC
jgi:hypothetical protein